ncbi:hypothetical protein MSAN_00838300 [Mycena sanguinolenta]|uniref:F-box domain-containing protein n=1 Tax=Mycena sanguinolenta TaxID=230812 RepID=A0A8H6YZS2_9AGAR|nr:hypothetical protein MSAN_00838300 [Mycena sanguinolenta]
MFEFLSNAVSPFADKLRTNYVPSDEEIAHLRDFLVGPTEQLAKIQAQIDEMELVVGQLKAKRESLQIDIDAHKALISPMRHIPDDVLRAIFFACLPTAHNALIDIAEAPLLLGRICRRWRVVAYSTPMLWTSIHIAPLRSCGERGMADFLPQLQPVIEQWLERGAPCPLTVSLVEKDSFLWSDPEFYPISLLRNFFHRLYHLSLCGNIRLLLPLLRLGPESLPMLKSIDIYNSTNKRYPFGIEHPEALNLVQIPSLTGISLQVMVDPVSLPLNWSQLTHLDLRCFPPSKNSGLDGAGALELLRRCPNLVRCLLRLYRDLDDASLASNTSLITLPHLGTLILIGDFHLPQWIPHLVVPRLRCLQIGNLKHKDLEWFGASVPHCVTAAIDTTPFTESGLLNLLQAFPQISHLRLLPHRFHPAVLPNDALLLRLSSHDLCPNLTHLYIKTKCVSLSDALALAFIRARMASPTPLQLFEAEVPRPMEIDVKAALEPFISAGLEVSFTYSPPSVRQHDEERHFNARVGVNWFTA